MDSNCVKRFVCTRGAGFCTRGCGGGVGFVYVFVGMGYQLDCPHSAEANTYGQRGERDAWCFQIGFKITFMDSTEGLGGKGGGGGGGGGGPPPPQKKKKTTRPPPPPPLVCAPDADRKKGRALCRARTCDTRVESPHL